MDLLEQYKQQNPEAFQNKKPTSAVDIYGREYTGMMAWIIRISGGKIHDAKQASVVLLILAVVVAVAAVFLFAQNFNLFPPRRMTAEEARKQLEEYRKIQPF